MTRGEIENHKSLLNIFEFFFRHEKYAQSLSKPHCVDHVWNIWRTQVSDFKSPEMPSTQPTPSTRVQPTHIYNFAFL